MTGRLGWQQGYRREWLPGELRARRYSPAMGHRAARRRRRAAAPAQSAGAVCRDLFEGQRAEGDPCGVSCEEGTRWQPEERGSGVWQRWRR